jgi:hypothetical protein
VDFSLEGWLLALSFCECKKQTFAALKNTACGVEPTVLQRDFNKKKNTTHFIENFKQVLPLRSDFLRSYEMLWNGVQDLAIDNKQRKETNFNQKSLHLQIVGLSLVLETDQ